MINDDDVVYEIRLSQGKGIVTKKCEKLLIELCDIQKAYKWDSFNNDDDREDAHMTSVYMVFKAIWSIDLRYKRKAIPYIYECYHRGIFHYMSNEICFKDHQNEMSLQKLFEGNYEN